jgi:hypothetical protein
MTMRFGPLALIAAAFSLAGCDDHLFPASSGAEVPDGGYPADWEGVSLFFADHCEACHAAAAPILPDDVEADVAAGAGALVVAGDPEASKLWLSIAHEAGAVPMPFGQADPLPQDVIDPVRVWIADGALLE